jgi:hypothetical protein
VLAQPAQSLTDLALGLVAVMLATQLRRLPSTHAHWRAAFWWSGIAALAGAVHHGVVVHWDKAAEVSWAIISVIVVVAVSYLLAATVAEVLGSSGTRAFWLLRCTGLLAYIVIAATGHAGVAAILACESLTMLSVLGLWVWAAYRHHHLAGPVLFALVAGGAASATKALNAEQVQSVGLDPTSAYHLAQIVGIVLLYVAVRRPPAAPSDSGPPAFAVGEPKEKRESEAVAVAVVQCGRGRPFSARTG